jgi:hypothetical protein
MRRPGGGMVGPILFAMNLAEYPPGQKNDLPLKGRAGMSVCPRGTEDRRA